ncbi:MAG: PAS domain S-box protein [Chloroflexota bacterium]|nr:PAS domain S-box protein [Chloroflexota bacterium]
MGKVGARIGSVNPNTLESELAALREENARLSKENDKLKLQAQGVADANARAAELMAELEDAKQLLQYRVEQRTAELNRALNDTTNILESMPVGVIVVGRDKKVRMVNRTALEMVGVNSKKQILGQTCHYRICPAEENHCPILDLGEKVDNSERILLDQGGRYIPILKTVVPMTIGDEDVLVEAFVDITERKRAEEELRQAYADLEEAKAVVDLEVAQRTQQLTESEAKLTELVEKLRLSQKQLYAPVIQVWDRILVLPLTGFMDEERARHTMDILLSGIVDTKSEVVILDVTGIATMDTRVTGYLLRAVAAAWLLGMKCVVTGIRPEVAQTIVSLHTAIGSIETKRDLQAGLEWALNEIGFTLPKMRPLVVG